MERVAEGVEVLRLRPPGRVQRLTNIYLLEDGDGVTLFDGGPVKVDDTVSDGDEVAGFRVLHLPGHAPGLIGLWRESDRLAIVSDAVFVLNPFTVSGRPGPPRIASPQVRPDPEAARPSVRRIIELDPSSVWLGHYGPLTGNVRSQLETAAGSD